MKLVHREISEKAKDTSGSVTLVPEEMEDMWHIYNLIAVEDYVRASTIRQAGSISQTCSRSLVSHGACILFSIFNAEK